MNVNKVEKIFNHVVASKHVHEAVLLVENGKGEIIFSGEYKDKTIDSPIVAASISKLFTTTCILVLLEQGKLTLEDKLSQYIDKNVLEGLHRYKGRDYSQSLTISNLLFQTSGLPDIYEEGEDSLVSRIIKEDFSMTLDQAISLTKQRPSIFPPSSVKRAHYTNINFDLLGHIVEKIMNKRFYEVCQAVIFEPLHLQSTYFLSSDAGDSPYIYYNNTKIHRSAYLRSFHASGGAISTTSDLMTFIKAFFGGKLFDKTLFKQLNTYARLQSSMFPIQYGGGYMRIPLKSILTLYLGKGELLGHSGSTGSFAFYYPEKDMYLVGDINQMTKRALPIQMMMQIVSVK